MPIPSPILDQEYLHDGVYVCHDGYQLWLRTGNHYWGTWAPGEIALDPTTFSFLFVYAQRVGFIKPSPTASTSEETEPD